MAEPRFKVGDFVVLKTQMEAIRLFQPKWEAPSPFVLMVLAVVRLDMATGGEVSYHCCGCSPTVMMRNNTQVAEIELDPAPTQPLTEKE